MRSRYLHRYCVVHSFGKQWLNTYYEGRPIPSMRMSREHKEKTFFLLRADIWWQGEKSKQTKERSKGYIRRWEGSRVVVKINKTGESQVRGGFLFRRWCSEKTSQREWHLEKRLRRWKRWGVNMRMLGGTISRQRCRTWGGSPTCIQGTAKGQGGQRAEEGRGVSREPDAQSLVTNPLKRSVSLRVMGRDWGTSSRKGTCSEFHLKGIPLAVVEDRLLRACPCRGASLVDQ